MDTGYFFDNVLVASDPAAAAGYRTSHWAPKLAAEVGNPTDNLCALRAQAFPETWTLASSLVSDPAAAAGYRTSHWAPKLAAEVGNPMDNLCALRAQAFPETWEVC